MPNLCPLFALPDQPLRTLMSDNGGGAVFGVSSWRVAAANTSGSGCGRT
jgi:hypothetical protein